MAANLHALKTYYYNVMRSDFAHIPPAHQALLVSLASQIDRGTLTLYEGRQDIIRLAIDTTSVASMAYSFFTGGTPSAGGFDYLVSASGVNPNNLNSAYYQSANIDNRYINFAVNLGKNGEGATAFAAAYGGLTMAQAVAKAYAEIFGTVPNAAKIDDLLNTQVPNGLGGTYTRNAYFAVYGGDSEAGIGTKAAMVGWLLSAAAKENIGIYDIANDAFLGDLAQDGVAAFRSSLISFYFPPKTGGSGGVSLSVAPDKSISPSALDPAQKSTSGDDFIMGTAGLGAPYNLDADAGRDTINLTGVIYGQVTTADGGDTVTLGALGATTPTLGVPAQYGNVSLGANGNVVTLKGGMAAGTRLNAAGTANTLIIDSGSAALEGTISGFQNVQIRSGGLPSGITGVATIYSLNGGGFAIDNTQTLILKDNGAASVIYAPADPTNGAKVHLHLQNFQGAPTTDAVIGRGVFDPNGGAIGLYTITDGPTDNKGTLILHVDTDSTAGLIYGWTTNRALGPNYRGELPNLNIVGAGKLTAQISGTFKNVDATMAGDLDLSYAVALNVAQTFRLGDGTNKLAIYFDGNLSASSAAVASKIYLGAGVDTIGLGYGEFVTTTATRLSNLHIKDGLTLSGPPEVINFQKGVDHIVLDAQVHGLTADVQQYADGKASLQDALIAVSAHVAINTGAVFSWNGDTYIYNQNAVVGVDMGPYSGAGDGLIKLTGVTGLTVGTGAGSYDIHHG